MTNEEAKEYILANWFDGDKNVKSVVYGDKEYLTMKLAVEAVEKQIPKKPKKYPLADGQCPCCNSVFYSDWKPTENYCHNCGQEIDWSDEE